MKTRTYLTTASAAALAVACAAISSSPASAESCFIDRNGNNLAAAAASSNAPFPPEPGQTSYAANTAVFRGQAAVSVSLTHRLRGPKSFAITGGVSHSGGKDTLVKAGVAGIF